MGAEEDTAGSFCVLAISSGSADEDSAAGTSTMAVAAVASAAVSSVLPTWKVHWIRRRTLSMMDALVIAAGETISIPSIMVSCMP